MSTIRANSDSKFLRRFLLIAAVLLGYGLWSLYDAVVKSPGQIKKANAHWVTDENGQLSKRYSSEEWNELATKNGWPLAEPKKPLGARGFLIFNTLMAAICLPGGLFALWKYFKSNNTWIESDGEKLSTSWGQEFRFSDIESIDKRKWDHKGVARVAYSSGGSVKNFILDDFKYERGPTDEILLHLEKNLTDSQIINGTREGTSDSVSAETSTE